MPASKKRSSGKKASSKKKSSSKSGSNTVASKDLEGMFLLKLQSLYDVETRLVKALPKMAKKAGAPGLREAFEKHAVQTEGHVDRLERSFEMLGLKPKKLKTDAIEGLIADAEWVMKTVKDSAVRDAGMIAAGQYVEHYEMAGYGTAAEWARLLGQGEIAGLMQQTLQEEKDADAGLNELAQSQVNERAIR